MFIRLGLLAAVRDLRRSMLAIISVALATMVLVVAFVVAQGVPPGSHLQTRAVLGGDIVIVPATLGIFGAAAPADATWGMVRRAPDNPGLLSYFFPQLIHGGLLGGEVDLDDPLDLIENVEGVLHASAYRTIPARMLTGQGQYWVQVRSRPTLIDEHYGVSSRVVDGRGLTEDDAGRDICVIDVYTVQSATVDASEYAYDRWDGVRPVMGAGSPSIRQHDTTPVGDNLQLILPGGEDPDGVQVQLEVVGHMQFQTGSISWTAEALMSEGLRVVDRFGDSDPIPGRYITEDLYFTLPEVWVTEETFDGLLSLTGSHEWAAPTEYLAVVADMSQVNVIADRLREALPGASVITAEELVSLSDLLPYPAVAVPPEDILRSYADFRAPAPLTPASPDWFDMVLVIIAVSLASVLFVGNLYVLTITRSKQMAALKALGSHNWQVVTASLTEITVLTLVGSAAGYIASSPMLLSLWSAAALGTTTLIWRLARAYCLMTAIILPVILFFSFIPLVRVVRLSPGEVLRDA